MENFFNKKYTIRLVWVVTIIFVVFSVSVFVYLKYVELWLAKEAFDYTSKLVLIILGILTLLYHLHNLENQIKTQEKSNRQNLAKYTYDICADFRKPMMMDINENLRKLIDIESKNLEKNKIDKFNAFLDKEENIDYRKALIITLNYFEGISAMVLAGDLDNEIVKRHFGKLFGRYYDKLKHYINYRQIDSPKSWCNYEKLSKKWNQEDKD